MKKLSIHQWSRERQPRERLIDNGPESLSDAELLAILIGSGNAEESAVALTDRLLDDCNRNLNTLGKRTLHELMQYKGIGEAKAVSILAACELGRRRAKETPENRACINSAQAIYDLMHPQLQDKDIEEAWVILLNQRFKLIKYRLISRGGITETAVDVRLILREALLANATIVALCHNHPSNNPTPSHDDDRLTESVKKACEMMRLHFLDHVIITDGQYYSYHEQGKM